MPVAHGPSWMQYAFIPNKINMLVTNAHNRVRRPCKRWDTPHKTPILVSSQHGALPIELVGRSRCIEGPGLLGIGIIARGRRGILGVPTRSKLTVTEARLPRVRVCARLRTRQPGAPGERFRHRRTHGVPPGGASIGHARERSSSTSPHDGGPVVRGTSSRGHRGYSVAITAKRPW